MSRALSLVGVSKHFGGTTALCQVSFDVPAGAMMAVIGPSGCGKTTLLKVIAGLTREDAGDVLVGGDSLGGVGAAQRPVSMVFQTDALFPDLTVRDNVSFGLDPRNATDAEAVEVILLRFGISRIQQRYPQELSGGQRRRAALARSLVTRPDVLLLDEPLAGLDGELRAQLAGTIRTAQLRFGATTLFATHDLEEALSLADLVAVMRDGRIEQIGTPRDVYTRPESSFVASFTGRANLFDVDGEPDGSGQWRVRLLGEEHLVHAHPSVRDSGLLLVRPEAVTVSARNSTRSWTEVSGAIGLVSDVLYYGSRTDYILETEGGMVTASAAFPDDSIHIGDGVSLSIDASNAWLLPDR